MPYLFTCPHCQTRTEVEDQYSGQSGECVVCGRQIQLPDFAPQARAATQSAATEARDAKPKPKRPLALTIAAVVLLLLVGSLVVAAVRLGGTTAAKLRSGRERLASLRNMEKIAAALNAYAADHGAYPVPILNDKSGKPLHSWRVLILPYLDHEDIHDRMNLSVSWQHTTNQQVAYQDMPSVYRHPNSQSYGFETPYCLAVGPGTLFPKTGPLGPAQITDGTSKTILLVEAQIPSMWTEPVDLDVTAAGGTINTATGTDFGGATDGGVCVVTADGRGHFLPDNTPTLTLNALLTPRGGEPLPDDVLDQAK